VTGAGAIVTTVVISSHLRRAALAAGLIACALAGPASAATVAPRSGAEAALLKSLLRSRELWATIDVCSPSDQPNYVGVRGSMPGDRHPHDAMYMSFRLQYMEAASRRWVDLASAKPPAFVFVGPAGSVRQGGRSFKLVPAAGKPASTLRGVVEYQWRRGRTVLQSGTRPTTAGRTSLAGADPPGFSAESCLIG
jgi:hypothetical protein